jgi:hypothetical protein
MQNHLMAIGRQLKKTHPPPGHQQQIPYFVILMENVLPRREVPHTRPFQDGLSILFRQSPEQQRLQKELGV